MPSVNPRVAGERERPFVRGGAGERPAVDRMRELREEAARLGVARHPADDRSAASVGLERDRIVVCHANRLWNHRVLLAGGAAGHPARLELRARVVAAHRGCERQAIRHVRLVVGEDVRPSRGLRELRHPEFNRGGIAGAEDASSHVEMSAAVAA